jgi:hypothetical protein
LSGHLTAITDSEANREMWFRDGKESATHAAFDRVCMPLCAETIADDFSNLSHHQSNDPCNDLPDEDNFPQA